MAMDLGAPTEAARPRPARGELRGLAGSGPATGQGWGRSPQSTCKCLQSSLEMLPDKVRGANMGSLGGRSQKLKGSGPF